MRWLVCVLLWLWPAAALAHPLAPVAVNVQQRGEDVRVSVKQSRVQPRGASLTPRFPARCKPADAPVVEQHRAFIVSHYQLTCPTSLVGSSFGVDGLSEADVDAVIRLELDDGRQLHALVDRSDDAYVVPPRAQPIDLLRAFARSGFGHLLGGYDHVLYVLGLALLLRRTRRVLTALTAFTVGHLLSMFATALGWVSVPSTLAEAAIAGTLVWLAYRLVRPAGEHPDVEPPALTRPYVASLAVGLIHGLGFASAFESAGMSGTDLWLALGGFHLGIELGQLVVVCAALLLLGLFAHSTRARAAGAPQMRSRLLAGAGYVIGAISFSWLIERVASMMG